MKHKTKFILTLLLILSLFTNCGSAQPSKLIAPSPAKDVDVNDIARYLAGIPVSPKSPLFNLTQKKVFREHAALMDKFWSEVLRENVFNIIPWRNKYLLPHFDYGVAFYPLSGGDFINLYLFYPLAKKYIMVSLESPGRLPNLLQMRDHEIQSGLRSLRNAIGNIAKKNYMMSAVMRQEMKNPFIEGTLPTILTFAARMELDIKHVESICLTNSGKIVCARDTANLKEESIAHGNRIIFRVTPTGIERELIYLCFRLRHDSFDPTAPGGQFFANLRDLNVIIKSAFYLLHRASFGRFCNALLERTRLLVQDDSGLPFRYFTTNEWVTFLFGFYTHPLALRDMPNPVAQPELAGEFKKRAQPLPFNFGYGSWRHDKKSNLIIAIKKDSYGKSIPDKK
ncbi:MAG: hypothetical protein N2316_07355 [Spirochaetes bacterium]|nr:hypothetical protein [Spirochaetota bacterium]